MMDLARVIHASVDADLDNFVYTKVYAASAQTAVINGVSVPMIAGVQLEILIEDIGSTTGIFVLGRNKIEAPLVINK